MAVRLGTLTVRNLYTAVSLITVTKEISKYKLGLMEIQQVRWKWGGTEPAAECTFLCGKGNENH
jgi:squalene cyclase